VQALQNGRNAGRQIVVEQDGAGIETLQPEPVFRPDQWLKEQALAVRQLDRRRLGDFRQQGTEAHIQPGLLENGGNLRDVLQIELVARVVFRNQQQAARLRAEFFNGAHRRLNAKRQEGRVQVVEAAREKIGIDRRQLEAGITQVDRRIERRRVLLPLAAQPMFDLRAAVEKATFEVEDGAGQGGCQVGNHGLSRCL
jgi:hypothetical protein